MKIAFYAPLKPPDHPVPSGDRLMARQFIAALGAAGHRVSVVSALRARMPDPDDTAAAAAIHAQAGAEVARLTADWRRDGSPDLWFCYHPYYKSPDLIGQPLCTRFGLPYVTAESSFSTRRSHGVWAANQRHVLAGLGRAVVNICLTARDAGGIRFALPGARTALLPPFVDPCGPVAAHRRGPPAEAAGGPVRLATVAMMRHGEKARSYRMLAEALALLPTVPDWTLSVVGSGPDEAGVRAAFSPFGTRVRWLGQLPPEAVRETLAGAELYLWPGFGEAYGLAYLEAQAAGLPVVAQATAGVPAVVADGETGLLTPEGDVAAFAGAVARLVADRALRDRMGRTATEHVARDHAIATAAGRLSAILAAALDRSE